MKKLLLTTILILSLSSIPTYAQEEKLPTDPGGEEMQIQIQEENSSEEAEDSQTLSDELQVTQENSVSFITILFATLTPALLLVVAYLLIKMSNK